MAQSYTFFHSGDKISASTLPHSFKKNSGGIKCQFSPNNKSIFPSFYFCW